MELHKRNYFDKEKFYKKKCYTFLHKLEDIPFILLSKTLFIILKMFSRIFQQNGRISFFFSFLMCHCGQECVSLMEKEICDPKLLFPAVEESLKFSFNSFRMQNISVKYVSWQIHSTPRSHFLRNLLDKNEEYAEFLQ